MNGFYTYAATGLIAAALAATGAWKVQDWRYGAKEKERVESQLADERLAATARVRREEQIITAQNEAQARARRNRLDAAGSRAAADGLRDDIMRTRAEAATSLDACTLRTNTLSELLGTVEAAGRGMAEKAGLHANDVQTLMEAWPK